MLVSKHDALTNAIFNSVHNFLQVKEIAAYKELSGVLFASLPFTTILISDAISGETFE
jgi:hypothetical protein